MVANELQSLLVSLQPVRPLDPGSPTLRLYHTTAEMWYDLSVSLSCWQNRCHCYECVCSE